MNNGNKTDILCVIKAVLPIRIPINFSKMSMLNLVEIILFLKKGGRINPYFILLQIKEQDISFCIKIIEIYKDNASSFMPTELVTILKFCP